MYVVGTLKQLEHFSALTGSPIANLKTGLRGLYKSERNRTQYKPKRLKTASLWVKIYNDLAVFLVMVYFAWQNFTGSHNKENSNFTW